MRSITIDRRFRGPPTSANGGYACGLVANAIGGSGEVTLRAPPPLDQPLEIVQGPDGSVELRIAQTLLATGRQARVDVAEIPAASFAEAEDAARRSLSARSLVEYKRRKGRLRRHCGLIYRLAEASRSVG